MGTATVASRNQAFLWSEGGSSTLFLSSLAPVASTAPVISDDGSSIFGAIAWTHSSFSYRKRGDVIESMTYLGDQILFIAADSNSDGTFAVGHNFSDSLLWTSDESNPVLPTPSGFGPSYPRAITEDGSVVYGFMTDSLDSSHAYIWRRGIGTTQLGPYLQSLGTDVSEWLFGSVGAVSADGTSIAGAGLRSGQRTGFVIRGLPSIRVPCLADYNGEGDQGDIIDFLDFMSDFAACEQAPAPCGDFGVSDLNGDTIVDIIDFLDFMDAFAQGCN
ncbi:MAG: hypothetical protein KF912_01065 [Phycisphaeraceae bacterium]|nr:hypothetical protein [Phycisphaeraceae bacterium]MBX3365888.1 hypothetical protein [Phycisphaeraceae bacterium]